MKYVKTTMLLMLFACATVTAHAQQGRSPFDQKKAVSHTTDAMAKDLGLTAAQKQKVAKINEERAARRTAIRAEMKAATPKTAKRPPETVKAKAKADRKVMRKDYRQKLKGILTPEQFEKWKELKAENRTKKGKK